MEETMVHEPAPQSKLKGPRALLLGLAMGLIATGGYAVHEHNNAKQMADETAQVQASLQATNAQIAQLTAKLNDLTAPKPAPVVATARSGHRRHVVNGHVVSDARWKKMQAQLDAQNQAIDANGKAIEATRNDLNSARTELGGSIARTHDELVALQRKGERNYFEFDLSKSKGFQTTGPVGVHLKKANVKHQYADLELLVDDVSLTKKHVNLFEPAVFYAADSDHPVELVINKISKDHIHGYVSAPKYRRSELASMSQGSSDASGTQPANGALKTRAPQPSAPQQQ